MSAYRLYGLTFSCDIPLCNAPTTDDEPELTIARVPDAPAGDPPHGTPLAQRSLDQELASALVRRDDRTVVFWLHSTAVFTYDLAARRIECCLDPRADEGLLPILVSGMVLSSYLILVGKIVLHASAVQVERLGGCVLFVGSSGMGKSTLAALMAADGGLLVADDVVHLDRLDGRWVAHRGVTEARLRPKAAGLAAGREGRQTVDGRVAVVLQHADHDPTVKAVVIPGPARDTDEVVLTPLGKVQAVMALLSHPRIVGWCDPAAMGTDFAGLSAFARDVPVFTSRIPWGPPFSPEIAGAIVSQIQAELGAPPAVRQ